MTLQQKYEEMMGLYNEITEEVRRKDEHLYERWKAGGCLVSDNVMSMYPHLGEVVESLDGEEEYEEEE